MEERIRQLIDIAGLDGLVKKTNIAGTRWRTVRYDKRTRISTQELNVLIELYPNYALWLASGNIAPEIGQTSPEYDEATKKLDNQNAV